MPTIAPKSAPFRKQLNKQPIVAGFVRNFAADWQIELPKEYFKAQLFVYTAILAGSFVWRRRKQMRPTARPTQKKLDADAQKQQYATQYYTAETAAAPSLISQKGNLQWLLTST